MRHSSICGIAACARARKGGRARSPRPAPGREPEPPKPEDRILHVSSFRDPVREIDKLTDLYDSLADARRDVGEDVVPFHRFAELVKNQVKKLRDTGSPEVAFRVAVKDGKVNFTARGLKGGDETDGGARKQMAEWPGARERRAASHDRGSRRSW